MKIAFLVFFVAERLFASTLFSQDCRNIGEDYLRFRVETESSTLANNSALAFKITAYEDENCKVPYLNYNQYFTALGLRGEQLDLNSEKVTYTALSEEVASALRLIKYCGHSEWLKDAETPVTGEICDDFPQLKKGDHFYQIIRLEYRRLKLGMTDEKKDGRNVQSRPVQFDEFSYSAD